MVKTKAKASGKAELGVDKLTAWQMYEKALQERKSKDPNDRRQACEKAWLAVTIAVDEFLATKGRSVPKGTADTHVMRNAFLAELAPSNDDAKRLVLLVPVIAEMLHGTCFSAGKDMPYCDQLLETTVREILERTGHAP